MKRVICFLMAALMLLSFAGCESKAGKTGGDITVTDHAGNTVTVPGKVDRVAVCGIYPLPSVLSIFFNSAEKIVSMPKQSMSAAKNSLLGQLYPDILNADTECFAGDKVNVESLMKLDPQVVFYSASDAETGNELRNAGFNAIGISVNKWNYDCIETLNQWISLLSQIFPEDAKTDKITKKSKEIYDLVQERVSKLSDDEKARVFVLFQYSETNMLTSGKNFFGQWWCDAIGAKNVSEELSKDNSVAVNMEQVYAWNPDTILVTNFTAAQPENLYNNTIGAYDWSAVDAVKNKRVYKMPMGMYRSYTPGADTAVTLLYLAKTVYPDLFKDIDISEHAVSYYKDVFGIELTKEQIESIFKPSSATAGGF